MTLKSCAAALNPIHIHSWCKEFVCLISDGYLSSFYFSFWLLISPQMNRQTAKTMPRHRTKTYQISTLAL